MNPESPIITFIIPVYKALPWLERSLGSIVDSEKKAPLPVEILICDDASPDGTGQMVNRLAGEDERIVRCIMRQTAASAIPATGAWTWRRAGGSALWIRTTCWT